MESSRVKRRRLPMVPCPYQGHINPMLHLATFLHQNGFSITIAHTFFNSPHPYRHPEFTFLPLNDGITDDHVSSWDLASVLLAINENCKGSLEEARAAMAGGDGEESSEVVCIIHDELMYYCEGVASHLPLVARRTSSQTRLVLGITTLHNDMILSILSLSSHGFALDFCKRPRTNEDSIPHL